MLARPAVVPTPAVPLPRAMLPNVNVWLPAETLASATVPVPLKLRFSPATTLPSVSAALEIFSVPS